MSRELQALLLGLFNESMLLSDWARLVERELSMAQYIEDRFKAQRGPTDSLSHYMRMGTCMLSVDQWWEKSIVMTLTRLKYFKV